MILVSSNRFRRLFAFSSLSVLALSVTLTYSSPAQASPPVVAAFTPFDVNSVLANSFGRRGEVYLAHRGTHTFVQINKRSDSLIADSNSGDTEDGDNASDTKSGQSEIKNLENEVELEGAVEKKTGTMENALRELGKELHHLKRSTWDVFCEAQRQDTIVVAEPDVIGPVIIPAMPTTTGILPGGLMPPRKKWIDYFMNQVESLLPMVEKDIAAIELPSEASAEAQKQYKRIKECGSKLPDDLENLKSVTAGEKLENMPIAVRAQKMQDRIVSIDKAREKLYKEIKKEDHQLKREVRKLEKELKNKKKEEQSRNSR